MSFYRSINIIPSSAANFNLQNGDCISSALYNLFFTIPGTNLFNPTNGLGVQNWLYEPACQATYSIKEVYIRNAIKQWEPRISVSSVNFSYSNNVLTISLSYTYNISGVTTPGKFKVSISK
jgi:phage baseplate assembly protein W